MIDKVIAKVNLMEQVVMVYGYILINESKSVIIGMRLFTSKDGAEEEGKKAECTGWKFYETFATLLPYDVYCIMKEKAVLDV